MTNATPPAPNNTIIGVFIAFLIFGIVAMCLLLGFNVSAANGAELSEWQQYVVVVLSGTVGAVLTFIGKYQLDQRKNSKFLTQQLAAITEELTEVRKENVALKKDVKELTKEVQYLRTENNRLRDPK